MSSYLITITHQERREGIITQSVFANLPGQLLPEGKYVAISIDQYLRLVEAVNVANDVVVEIERDRRK